jgi:uncharacterized protein YdhG (YjbR/CyaY superfamily)
LAAPKTVDEYIAAQAPPGRTALRHVRGIIRKAIPGAEESISYRIPTYKIDGRSVVYFAGFKEHYSIYPVTDGVRAELGDALAGYQTSKGTVRFPLDRPVPVRLIQRIVRLLAGLAAERRKAAKARKRR